MKHSTIISRFWTRLRRARIVLLMGCIIVALSGCGLRETAETSVAQQTQPTVIPTITLSAQEATNEALRATNMAGVANDIATSQAMPTLELWPTLPPNSTYDLYQNPGASSYAIPCRLIRC